MTAQSGIDSVLKEARVFNPPAEFQALANVASIADYERLYREADEDPETFWGKIAEDLHWFRKWDKVLDWDVPWAKWFSGGQINLSYNCLDRHVASWRRNKAALIWEGEPGEVQTLTFQQLLIEVSKFANVLKSLGVEKGDRVAIYMGMTPALPIALLACARIGAPHTVIFGGFSAAALVDRIHDCQASFVITQDGTYRRGAEIKLKPTVDEALSSCPTVKRSVVFQRTKSNVTMVEGRDVWWHEAMTFASSECPAEPLDAEHPLFLLYTSGITGKPKGILHTTGGYAVGTYASAKRVFDLREEDIYWCTADIGWVTGHSYIVYGPHGNPRADASGQRMASEARDEVIAAARLGRRTDQPGSLDVVSRADWTESLSHRGHLGQTETGMIMISPLPGATPTKPGSATRPLPGVAADVVTREGDSVPLGGGGYLVVKKPWPAMLRNI